jgi:membrane protein
MLGASLTLTSYAISASSGLVQQLPGGVKFVLEVAEFGVLTLATGALFYYVPHAPVAWRHALAGGFFVAAGMEIARHALGWYLKAVPTYSNIYGAFATVPIFLLWIYLCWVIVLLGAVVAAYAPSLQMRMVQHGRQPGQAFALALEIVRRLWNARDAGSHGLPGPELAATLRMDPLLVETALESLMTLDWVGRLEEGGHPRYVLLCDPARTRLAPLVDAILLAPVDVLAAVRGQMQVERIVLADVLPA